MAYHQELTLENFTVFQQAHFAFSAGINIFVGANGTGKTHLMKLLYSEQYNLFRDHNSLDALLQGIFQTTSAGDLIRNQGTLGVAAGKLSGKPWRVEIQRVNSEVSGALSTSPLFSETKRPIFIPATDMIGHTRRFLTTYDEYQIDFDQTHRDIVALLLAPEKRDAIENPSATLRTLSDILGGEIEEESERFFLKTPQGRQPMPLVADGLRKIATLYQLLKNGFLQPGTTLFWDEPEIHLSPILMDEVVAALLDLSRSGVQIFLATHSYVILKELDLQAQKQDDVRYFALQLTPQGTKVEMTDDYAQLHPNPIAEQFDSIYDRELTRATGRRRK